MWRQAFVDDETEHSFHGVHSLPKKEKSVTYVSGTKCYPCVMVAHSSSVPVGCDSLLGRTDTTAMKGDRKGQYSIRINDQWRICFEWPSESPGPANVEIVDYH